MITTSQEWKDRIYNNRSALLLRAELKLHDGTSLYLDYEDKDDDFLSSGIGFTDETSAENTFSIGSAIMNTFSFKLNNANGKYDATIFQDAEIFPQIGMEIDGSVEWLDKGVYLVADPGSRGSSIAFATFDRMAKMHIPFSGANIVFPITLGALALATCAYCGVELATTEFPNHDYVIESSPIGASYNCRQIISFIAQIAGCYARFNNAGKLEIAWYRETENVVPEYNSLEADLLDTEITGVKVTSYYSDSAHSEDVEGGEITENSMYGEAGYVIAIAENPLIQYGQSEKVAELIGKRIVGTRFRSLNLKTLYDPSLEAGDKISITDVRGNTYVSFITNLSVNFGGYVNISCGAETAEENAVSGNYSGNQAVVEAVAIANAKFKNLITVHLEAEVGKFGYVKADTVSAIVASFEYATIKDLDAAKGRIEDLETNTLKTADLSAAVAKLGYATVENLNAATARIGTLESTSVKTDELESKVGTFGYLKVSDAEAIYVKTTTLDAVNGTVANLQASVANIEKAYVDEAKVNTLIAGKGYLTEAEVETLVVNKGYLTEAEVNTLVVSKGYLDEAAVNTLIVSKGYFTEAQVETLVANKGYITTVETKNLLADYATIVSLNATNASINNLIAIAITTENLSAKVATLGYAKITDLDAVNANISSLDAEVADINTLIFGSASGTSIHTSFANAVIAQLGNAQIKSAMIESISADKITAGDIITNNVRVMSEDGKLLISDETIQISDASRVRVQIGKDSAGDYSINIWDADGKLMFSEGGITDSAIKEAIIRNNMVTDDANISASKLDIDSLFTEINDSSQTIKATKIYLDDEKQTLDVAFSSMTSDISDLSSSVSSQGTAISVIQGQISSKVWQQDIETAIDPLATEESVTKLSTQYSELSQTVTGISSTVGEHATQIANKADSSTVTAVSDRVTSIESDLSGFKTTVSATYATQASLATTNANVTTAQTTANSALNQSIEYIAGTQTAATNAWTGVTTSSSLYKGKTIAYKLPYAGTSTAATLNLTLSTGSTTGAKSIRRANSTVTTQFPAGTVIVLTYDGTYWRTTSTNSDTYDRTRYSNAVKVLDAGTAYPYIMVGTSSGYKIAKANVSFDVSYPVLVYNSSTDLTAGGTTTNMYTQLPSATLRNNVSSWTGTQYAMAYLVGTLNGKTFTINSTVFTTTVPTSADGLAYIPIGVLVDTYRIYFKSDPTVYAYGDNGFAPVSVNAQADVTSLKSTVETTYATKSEVSQTESSILSTVSSTYATKTSLETVDGKFADYSTTEEMNSAINQSASSITATVSSTYATKTALASTDTKASNAVTAAANAQSSADSASSAASNAQTTADAAKSAANSAQSDVNALTTRVSAAEASIKLNADNIELKVSKDGVISAINQTAETVKISASKIELTGAVTFSSFSSDLQSQINGIDSDASDALAKANTAISDSAEALDTANSASSDASTAVSTANSASSTASTASTNASSALTKANTAITDSATAKSNAATALSTANTAKSTADSVNSVIANWCYNSDTTYIDGGNIYTGTITAAKIASGSITAEKIAAGAVTADAISAGSVTTAKIATGAITADLVAAGAITSDKIVSGAITTDKIAAGAITAAKIDVADLFAQDITATGTIRSSNMQIVGGYIQIEAAAKDSSIIKISTASSSITVTSGGIVVEETNSDGYFRATLNEVGLWCKHDNFYVNYFADGSENMAISMTNSATGASTNILLDCIQYFKEDDTNYSIYFDDIASMTWVEEQIILAIYSSWEASY